MEENITVSLDDKEEFDLRMTYLCENFADSFDSIENRLGVKVNSFEVELAKDDDRVIQIYIGKSKDEDNL